MAAPTYTRERLAEIAPSATSASDFLLRLGLEPNDSRQKYLRRKLTEYGIKTPHVSHPGIVYTKDLLEEAVSASVSFAGVVRYLKQRQAGGTQTHVARRIRQFGIDTAHFTGQAHYRGVRSPTRKRPEEVLTERSPLEKRVPGVRLRQALVETGRPDVCEDCGTGPFWNGRQLTLEVDHIDGNWSDNRPGNLRILCPNCHSTTDTYCGRNKGRLTRTSLGQPMPGSDPNS